MPTDRLRSRFLAYYHTIDVCSTGVQSRRELGSFLVSISGGRDVWIVILSAAKRLPFYRPHFAKDGSETGFGMPFGAWFGVLRAECSPIEKRTI